MQIKQEPFVEIPSALLDAIRSLPVQRSVDHCGIQFAASPFDFYAKCPVCGSRVKLRAFSASPELEDVFDAVFAWMEQPGAEEIAHQRRRVIAKDEDE
jgi:hypothetical protein